MLHNDLPPGCHDATAEADRLWREMQGERQDGPPHPEPGDPGPLPDGEPGPEADGGRSDGQDRPPRLAGLPWREAMVVHATDRLVARLLGDGGMSVVYGEPASGKTFLALDLALHVAMGWAWMGRRTTHGVVLYVAAEGQRGVGKRLSAWRARHEPKTDPLFRLVPLRIDLASERSADVAALIEAIQWAAADAGAPAAMVVIDTLSRAFGGGDENSAQDMARFVSAVDSIRAATGSHVMVVHHAGKDGARGARGSSVLRGAADTEIEVSGAGDGARIAAVKKQKDGADDAIGFRLATAEVGKDADDDPITTCVVEPAEATKSRQKSKLPPTQALALDTLVAVLADRGKTHTIRLDNGQQRDLPCAPVSDWRDALQRRGSLEDGDAGRKKFERMRDGLLASHHIQIRDGLVWILSQQ